MIISMIISYITRRPGLSLVAWLICVSSMISLLTLVILGTSLGWSSSQASDYVKLAFHPSSLLFIAGAFAGYAFLKGIRLPAIPFFVCGFFGFTVLLFANPDSPDLTIKMGIILVYAVPGAMLVYGAAKLQSWFSGSWGRVVGRLGDWSFALYLSHALTLPAIKRALLIIADLAESAGMSPELTGMLRIGTPGIADNIVFVTACLFASTLVSIIAFYGFERPVTRWLNRFRHRQTDKDKARMAETTAP